MMRFGGIITHLGFFQTAEVSSNFCNFDILVHIYNIIYIYIHMYIYNYVELGIHSFHPSLFFSSSFSLFCRTIVALHQTGTATAAAPQSGPQMRGSSSRAISPELMFFCCWLGCFCVSETLTWMIKNLPCGYG